VINIWRIIMAKIVFDMGLGHNITISNATFTYGLLITEDEDDIAMLQNYRKSLPYSMTEAEYDETNPMHTRNNTPATAKTDHVVNGILHSGSFAKRPDHINDVLGVTDGTAVQQLQENPAAPLAAIVDVEALVAAQQPSINMASILNADKGK
jgi:hypothetical protein